MRPYWNQGQECKARALVHEARVLHAGARDEARGDDYGTVHVVGTVGIARVGTQSLLSAACRSPCERRAVRRTLASWARSHQAY